MLHTISEAEANLKRDKERLKIAKRNKDRKMKINFLETCIACWNICLEESEWI